MSDHSTGFLDCVLGLLNDFVRDVVVEPDDSGLLATSQSAGQDSEGGSEERSGTHDVGREGVVGAVGESCDCSGVG